MTFPVTFYQIGFEANYYLMQADQKGGYKELSKLKGKLKDQEKLAAIKEIMSNCLNTGKTLVKTNIFNLIEIKKDL